MNRRGIRYLVGLDVGSTTVKAIVTGPNGGEILWKDYQRHGTHQAETTWEFLKRLQTEVGIDHMNCRMFFTGSGASGLAEQVGAKFVQEVHAVSLAVEKLHPDARSVIELGGQDAKIVVFKPDENGEGKRKFSTMNDKCAGGTGAVIDKIAAKLKICSEELSTLDCEGLKTHAVAGKCGVFAETDINSLSVQGVPRDELLASLFDAIVLQNLSVLTRGHTLHPQVLLLGGPNSFLPGMVGAWRRRIPQMWSERGVRWETGKSLEELILVPPNAQYYAAIGAVEFGRFEEESVGRYRGTGEIERYIRTAQADEKRGSGAPGLSRSKQELEDFKKRYTVAAFVPAAFRRGERVRGFIGVDAGSTSTKGVLLSEEGKVLSRAYRLGHGNPIMETIEVLGSIRAGVEGSGAALEVLGVGTTGYSKDVLRDVIQADVALVETVAHAKSALWLYPNPDVIVDVGGQDIKLILLKDGHVKDFMLNSQCSAGNGYFLQATAEGFGYSIEEYAEAAFSADAMPSFGYGCAVFMQSDIIDYQRQGWKPQEILAGLAAVLPKNIWFYVSRIPNLARLGTRFILQGGTQKNLAAVKAQHDFIVDAFQGSGRVPDIIVHEHCDIAGAIGAGLEAMRLWEGGRTTTFIGLQALGAIQYRAKRGEETRCHFCRNQCQRTFIDVTLSQAESLETARRQVIIATCEKGETTDLETMHGIKGKLDAIRAANPNLVDLASRKVWKAYEPRPVGDPIPPRAWTRKGGRRIARMKSRPDLRIGIPRVLAQYQYAPLFSAYLVSLGIQERNLVYSDYTTGKLYRDGAGRGAIDPCFPAKVAVSHVHNLIYGKHRKEPLDCIFFPMIDVMRSPLVHLSENTACCTVTATPESVKAAFTKERDLFAEQGIRFVEPLLSVGDPKLLPQQMFEAWEPILGLSERENERAVQEGLSALDRYECEIRAKGREVIEMLEREDRLGIVVLGRPYHHDPGLNHGIFEELQRRGYPILSQSSLPLDEDLLERLFGDEVRAGKIKHRLDINDVWQNSYNSNGSLKLFAAKFVARHPNLVALDISSFNCGQDAPIHRVCEAIVECSGTPYFAFRDVDENKPSASIRIRIETIDYTLERYQEKRRKACHPRERFLAVDGGHLRQVG